ncbi:MAG: IS1380 family transposase, partial [Pseudomonadota bacterium]
DARAPARIQHTYAEMVTAHMIAIACGYEDCDDLDALKSDPALKIACGRLPETGADLMSQPTLSRLENTVSWRTLARIGLSMTDVFTRSFNRPPGRTVLDIDETCDPVHGQQQLSLFNAHYATRCFQPIVIFDGLTGRPVTAILRPGKSPSGEEIATILRHVIGRIRKTLPGVRILVRGDSAYGNGAALDVLEALDCEYVLGFATNRKLKDMAAPWCAQCRQRLRSGRSKVRRFHQFAYRAARWHRPRKVIARVEATGNGTDARFIVTNLEGRGKHLYERVYCARGAAENLIKDFKSYTRADKTACSRWQANQFRLFLHIGAYWLLHGLRMAAPKRSRWRTATFATLRCTFVKIAVRVEEMKTRIRLSFPASYPHKAMLTMLTGAIAASGP